MNERAGERTRTIVGGFDFLWCVAAVLISLPLLSMFDRTRAVSSQISIMAAVPCVCDTLKKLVIDDVVASPSCDTVLIASSVVLGLGVMACIGLGLLKFTIKAVWPAKNLKKYGEWAVVTGATDGIGLGAVILVSHSIVSSS